MCRRMRYIMFFPISLINCYDTLIQYFTQKVVSQRSTRMDWSQCYANGFRKSHRLNLIIKGYAYFTAFTPCLYGPRRNNFLSPKSHKVQSMAQLIVQTQKGNWNVHFENLHNSWCVIVEQFFRVQSTYNISELTCFGGTKIRFSSTWQFGAAGFVRTHFAVK